MLGWVGRWGLRLLYGTGGVAVALLAAVVFFQRKLIYIPNIPGVEPGYYWEPDAFGLEYEDVRLQTKDGVSLHAWLVWPSSGLMRRRKKDAPVVLFFQENAGNMSFRLPFVAQMAKSCDCAVLMLSYRGYGASSGSPSQRGLQIDSQAALDWVLQRDDIDTSKIVLFGRSLGGAVAVHLAAANTDKIAAVIIENSFTTIPDMAGALMGFLKPIVGRGKPGNILVRDKWNNEGIIRALKGVPTLMLSSGKDEMVPAWQMRQLYAARGTEHCEWRFFPNGRHLDLYETHSGEYWPILVQYMEAISPHA
mmetsp:Transcript_1443/g.3714  ORF Transcript_1443/g.3714 Transcript_1443/m.3714 type:complete len:306 (+) Transcript_1443:276-1193(+)